ncbi:hypothetical protein [Rhizobium terrae]|uniref:hypothetical protein n=1 Tax=Rhizobium terrae TaxID=2171756 RepID=UPI000E3C44DB|nr:hypothetical protein [Rhizobium terrae]
MAYRPSGQETGGGLAPLLSRPAPAMLPYWLVVAATLLVVSRPASPVYLTGENDDVMRLVEVRDLLGGQGWFDLMQYRLGLAEGTPMHWSRLIDLPIAALIRFLSLFLRQGDAELLAATLWPVLLMPLLLLPLAIAASRIGGVAAMHVALGLGALFLFTCVRFAPGSLDHHNVQLVLATWLAALLTDPQKRVRSYIAAGLAASLALAVGAETTPLVAVACGCVALQWVWHGAAFAGSARAFGLSLTLSVSAAFFATVPPRDYGVVTCDNLSLGFYALSALGGSALFLLASLRPASRPLRFGMIGLTGTLLLLAARLIAPQCLGDPLASLDPMLTELWLRGVTEARSFTAVAAAEPEMVGGFYAAGLFAMAVCLFRSLRGEEVEFHLVLLALVGTSWLVALLQVRGAFFANLLSILPLSLLIADLRRHSATDSENAALAIGYLGTMLASVPVLWALGGVAAVHGWQQAMDASVMTFAGAPAAEGGECGNPADMAALNALPPGTVAAPSNSGAEILAATGHRVLSAPYHRDQKGMLTELHIGLSVAADAWAFLKGAGVTAVAFCPTDPQTEALIRLKPDGFYADLARGAVPAYLEAIGGGEGFWLYRVKPD